MNHFFDQHPLSAAFPAMSALELNDLVNDIRINGLRNPIVIFEGKVLDGWHRYRACERLAHDPETVTFPVDQDPVAFVRSQNYHRRHLTPSQKAVAEVELRKWAQPGRPKNPQPGSTPEPTTGLVVSSERVMAEAADVSTETIRQAKRVVEAGLADAVKSGEVSVKRAAEVAKLPEPERRAALEAPRPPRPKPEPRASTGQVLVPIEDRARLATADARIAELESQLEQLREDMTETARLLRDTQEENESLLRVVEADDQLKAAMAEAKRFREFARVVEERNKGLQGQCHALAGDAKRWMRKAQRLEKAQAKLAEEPAGSTPDEDEAPLEPEMATDHQAHPPEEVPVGLFDESA